MPAQMGTALAVVPGPRHTCASAGLGAVSGASGAGVPNLSPTAPWDRWDNPALLCISRCLLEVCSAGDVISQLQPAPGSHVLLYHLHSSRKTGHGCHSRAFVCPRGAGVALTSRSDSVEITRGQREGLGPRSALNSVPCWDLRADEPCHCVYILPGSHGRSCPRPESRVRPILGGSVSLGAEAAAQ